MKQKLTTRFNEQRVSIPVYSRLAIARANFLFPLTSQAPINESLLVELYQKWNNFFVPCHSYRNGRLFFRVSEFDRVYCTSPW